VADELPGPIDAAGGVVHQPRRHPTGTYVRHHSIQEEQQQKRKRRKKKKKEEEMAEHMSD
jgi:hypothetical protein